MRLRLARATVAPDLDGTVKLLDPNNKFEGRRAPLERAVADGVAFFGTPHPHLVAVDLDHADDASSAERRQAVDALEDLRRTAVDAGVPTVLTASGGLDRRHLCGCTSGPAPT